MSEVPEATAEAAHGSPPEAPEEGGLSRAVRVVGWKTFASSLLVFLLIFFVGERALYDENYVLGGIAMFLSLCLVPVLMASCGGPMPGKWGLMLALLPYVALSYYISSGDLHRAVLASFGPFGTTMRGILPYLLPAIGYTAFILALAYWRIFTTLALMSSTVTSHGLAHLAPLSPEEYSAQWMDLSWPAPATVLYGLSIKGTLRVSLMLAFTQLMLPFLYDCISLPLLDSALKFPYGMLLSFLTIWILPAYRCRTIMKNWPSDFTINPQQRLLLATSSFRVTYFSVLMSMIGGGLRVFGLNTGIGTCTDFDPKCSQWAAAGDCHTDVSFQTVCQLSCGLCQPGLWPSWVDLLWVLLWLLTFPAIRFTFLFMKASRRLLLSGYGVSESFAQQLVAQGTQLHELEGQLASRAIAQSVEEAEARERQDTQAAGAASSSQ